MSRFKFSFQQFHNHRILFYLSISLFISFFLIQIFSYNFNYNYGANIENGYNVNLFKCSETIYCSNQNYILPQGIIGQKLVITITIHSKNTTYYSATSDYSTFYLLLIAGGNRNYKVVPNYSENNMSINAYFIQKMYYINSKINATEIKIVIPFLQDNSYTIVYVASNQDKLENKTISLETNYKIYGQDRLALYVSSSLLILGIIIFPFIFIDSDALIKRNFSNNSLDLGKIKENYFLRQKNSKIFPYQMVRLIKYEFKALLETPFLIFFIPLLLISIGNRYNEVYSFWEIDSSSILGFEGSTLSINGILTFVLLLIFLQIILSLFLFKEIDEKIFKIHITLPRSRTQYLFVKFIFFLIPSLILMFVFIGTTFILIPFRNSSIKFTNLPNLFIIFALYTLLTVMICSIIIFILFIFLNSKNGLIIWLTFLGSWLLYSFEINTNLQYYSNMVVGQRSQENYMTHFTLINLNRVFEYFINRNIIQNAPFGISFWNDYIFYIKDMLIDSILIICFYLLIMVFCFVFSVYFFTRRDIRN